MTTRTVYVTFDWAIDSYRGAVISAGKVYPTEEAARILAVK